LEYIQNTRIEMFDENSSWLVLIVQVHVWCKFTPRASMDLNSTSLLN